MKIISILIQIYTICVKLEIPTSLYAFFKLLDNSVVSFTLLFVSLAAGQILLEDIKLEVKLVDVFCSYITS